MSDVFMSFYGAVGADSLSEREPSSVIDQSRFWDCVLDEGSGKPRLSVARQFFQPLTLEKVPMLIEAFQTWREFKEYIVLKAVHQITEEERYFAVKCSKRGNDVFACRLDSRLGFLRADEKFFDTNDFGHKDVKTRLIWVTLTYDSNRCSLDEAWRHVGSEFNLWITNLRNKYGRIHYVAFPQAFPDPKGLAYGYPHFHVIMLFEDVEFSVFQHLEKDRECKLGLVFRIEEKPELESQGKYHSWIDVKALSSMKAVWNYAKRHCYNAGYGESDEAILNNAVMWLYQKRSFNMSGDFRKRYTEFITHMRSSKTSFYLTLDGGRLDEWKMTLVGIFSVFELCIGGEDPPWSLELPGEDVSRLLARLKG